jgi:hypothetical protein
MRASASILTRNYKWLREETAKKDVASPAL